MGFFLKADAFSDNKNNKAVCIPTNRFIAVKKEKKL